MRTNRASAPQLDLPLRSWGGARRGAGRKPNGARAGVSHLARPRLSRHHPAHVTLRVEQGVPTLRTRKIGRIVFAAFAAAREKHGVRLTHFSVQGTHIHLLVEARDRVALSRGMQGLAVRLAARLNRALGRSGRFFADRYHARILKTPMEVRRAVLYVLNNHRRHLAQSGAHAPWDWADPSSVDYFDGFRPIRASGGEPRLPRAEFGLGRDPPVAPPRTWLLTTGWRMRGLLGVGECPGGAEGKAKGRGGNAR